MAASTITPNVGYVGTDTFTYYISNGYSTASATDTIDVVDAAPVANADHYTVRAGQSLTITAAYGVLANDIDPGATLTATNFSNAAHGSLNLDEDGSFTYTPDAGYTGTDTATYYISDGIKTASAVVSFDVVDTAPVANPDYYYTTENSTLTVAAAHGVLRNDFDPDGDPITATNFSNAAHGSLNLDEDGSFNYTPDAGYTGTDTATYYISDGTETASASINIQVVACYCRGTRILTDRGEVLVEVLAIGDVIVTASGARAPIRWIGRRSYAGTFIAGHHLMLPVCFKKGAIADGVPHADLWVSPGHAMFVDGQLVPAWRLVNGASITQANAVESVEYYHLELDRHAVILAEGAPAESFLNDGCRGQFHNAAEFDRLYPDAPDMAPLQPRLEDGFGLQVIQERHRRPRRTHHTRRADGCFARIH